MVAYFEIGVRVGGGYKDFSQNTTIAHNYLLIVLIIHIIIATLTLIVWTYTVIAGIKDYKRGFLPGENSLKHKKVGYFTYFAILFTAFTGIWVYMLLFTY